MELKINRKAFLEALSGAGQVAAKTSTLPVLENVRINIREEGVLVVTAFDLEVSAMRKFKFADSAEVLDFCVNPRDLIGVLKTLRDEEVVLVIGENDCVVKHAKGEVSLPTLPSVDFPSIDMESGAFKMSIDGATLFEWLKNASGFAGNDKLRPILNGVYMYVENNEMGVAASDGLYLFTDNMKVAVDEPTDIGGTLGSKAISPLLDMINGEEKVVVYFGEKMLSFRTSKAMLSCIKPVGVYPKFKRLISRKENPVKVSIDRKELIDSVSRAILSARVDICLLRLTAMGNVLSVDSEDLGFSKKSHEECPCVVEGGSIEIGVKGNNLMQCLSAIESDKVVFEFSDPKMSINIYDETCPNKSVVLMPIAIR